VDVRLKKVDVRAMVIGAAGVSQTNATPMVSFLRHRTLHLREFGP
jgi:hypothetical protein